MNTYLIIKWLHILSSVALVGVGFGSAFYLFFINRSRNLAAIAQVAPLVVKADWWFTTPTVFIQPITGFALVYLAGFPLYSPWLIASFSLFVLAGLCWLPVVWLQLKMAAMAKHAYQQNEALPAQYWLYAKYWTILGTLAFPMTIIVFALMVIKPM